MRLPLLPTRTARWLFGAAALATLAMQASTPSMTRAGVVIGALALAWALVDLLRSGVAWYRAPLRFERRLPSALAIGVPCTLACALVNRGPDDWWVELDDPVGPHADVEGLPLALYVPAHSRIELHYTLVPRQRGALRLGRARLTLRTLHGSFEWRRRCGETQSLRVHPDFAALARYDQLARERRLGEIGITAPAPRGAQPQDPVCVLFLLDCGERMCERGRFDAALNALVLLAHVALAEGDEVGAMTFGGKVLRGIAPRAGPGTLDTLMATLHDLQPQPLPSDFRGAACDAMRLRRKRALVVVLSAWRDDESRVLAPAFALLRSSHRVVAANLAGGPRPLGSHLVNRYREEKRLNPPG